MYFEDHHFEYLLKEWWRDPIYIDMLKQNLHWKLGQQMPSAGTLLAYLKPNYF